MHNQTNKKLHEIIETRFEMVNLNLEADKIKNSYKVQSCIEALIDFVGTRKLNYN